MSTTTKTERAEAVERLRDDAAHAQGDIVTRRAPYLVAAYIGALAICAAILVAYIVAGDGWRALGLSCVLVLLVMLRRTLTEEPVS